MTDKKCIRIYDIEKINDNRYVKWGGDEGVGAMFIQ
jgi:hypothetical protein